MELPDEASAVGLDAELDEGAVAGEDAGVDDEFDVELEADDEVD